MIHDTLVMPLLLILSSLTLFGVIFVAVILWRIPKKSSTTYTGVGATLTNGHFGRVVKFVNGGIGVTCNLPSVGSSDIDSWLIIMRIGSGSVRIQAADSDTIETSSAGGAIICSETTRVVANTTIYLASETKWAILAGTGIWSAV